MSTAIDTTIPDAATLQALTNAAVARAQRILVELSEQGMIRFGEAVTVAVRWPNQHKGEHFLFASTNGTNVVAVHPLSEKANKRMETCGGATERFWHWCKIQDWHEQLRFRINTNLQLQTVSQASGLILPGH